MTASPADPAPSAAAEVDRSTWRELTEVAELEALMGTPSYRAANKVRSRLHPLDVEWIAASPFCVLATADADGRCDTSPKGDPAGTLAHVIDDATVALAERPGNRRVDGYRNILTNPYVGLLFLIPGRGDTLRVNGRARILTDADFFDAMVVRGHRPRMALLVEVEEVFHHCAKAFLRSELWDPSTWTPEALPGTAELSKTMVPDSAETLDELREYYADANYRATMYRG